MNAPTTTSVPGIVYTFYSYKGGVGRSMALANCATLLAKWGHKVLIVDWDLEAPGLERFFSKVPGINVSMTRTLKPGMIDLIEACGRNTLFSWRDCTIEIPIANGSSKLDLITAGRSGSDYSAKLHALDFPRLFSESNLGTYIESLRDEWTAAYDFVLVDSRTGVTDIGGICTVHLADVLILLFTTTDSSISGILDIVERAKAARAKLPIDRAALVTVPVPARDESRTEYQQSQKWKEITATLFKDLYEDWLPASATAEEAVDVLRIPYIPYWSFGERLPVIEEGTRDPSSLGRAYEVLARLLSSRLDWKQAQEAAGATDVSVSFKRTIDLAWVEKQQRLAKNFTTQGIRSRDKNGGFIEAYYFCSDSHSPKSPMQLLKLAKSAEFSGHRKEIGEVCSDDQYKPRPVSDGIHASIQRDDSSIFWSLNENADFFCQLAPIEPDSNDSVFLGTRIRTVAELLAHSYRLYTVMGLSNSSRVHLTLTHAGFYGLRLSYSRESKNSSFSNIAAVENLKTTSISYTLEELKSDFAAKVMELCNPFFNLFDFQEYNKDVYQVHAQNYSDLT